MINHLISLISYEWITQRLDIILVKATLDILHHKTCFADLWITNHPHFDHHTFWIKSDIGCRSIDKRWSQTYSSHRCFQEEDEGIEYWNHWQGQRGEVGLKLKELKLTWSKLITVQMGESYITGGREQSLDLWKMGIKFKEWYMKDRKKRKRKRGEVTERWTYADRLMRCSEPHPVVQQNNWQNVLS